MAGSDSDHGFDAESLDLMIENALPAADFLKALAHEGRLLILFHLASGEKSVTDLEELLHYRQAAVSQQLARLRLEGLVRYRRQGKAIYYSLNDDRSRKALELVYDLFCRPQVEGATTEGEGVTAEGEGGDKSPETGGGTAGKTAADVEKREARSPAAARQGGRVQGAAARG